MVLMEKKGMECRDGEDFEVELGVNEVIWRFLVFEVDGFCEEWLIIWFCKFMLFNPSTGEAPSWRDRFVISATRAWTLRA